MVHDFMLCVNDSSNSDICYEKFKKKKKTLDLMKSYKENLSNMITFNIATDFWLFGFFSVILCS